MILSQRPMLAGRSSSSPDGCSPRAGLALGTISISAPSSAAIVGTMECHASSQMSSAARPQRVSKACTLSPAATKRSSSNTP